MLGIDTGSVDTLTNRCTRIGNQLEDTSGDVVRAETLAQVPTATVGALAQAARTLTSVAITVRGAAQRLADYRLHVDAQVNPVVLATVEDLADVINRRDGGRSWTELMALAQEYGVGHPMAAIPAWRAGAAGANGSAVGALGPMRELIDLLNDEFGDPAVVASVIKLINEGTSPEDALRFFAEGVESATERLEAVVMGGDPDELGVPIGVLPDTYREWHELDDEIADLELERDLYRLGGLGGTVFEDSDDFRDNFFLRVSELPEGHVLRDLADRLTGAPDRVLWAAIAEMADRSEHRIDQIEAQIAAKTERRDSLTYDGLTRPVFIDPDGVVSEFEAIVVTGAHLGIPPAQVGARLAESIDDFEFHEATEASGYLATSREASIAFFGELGPEATGTLLTDRSIDNLSRRPRNSDLPPPQDSEFARNMSIALGLASSALPAGFGSGMIAAGAGDDRDSFVVAPEYLLAHGEFDPDFLVEAASESLLWGGRGILLDEINDRPDPRLIAVEAIVDHGLGVELVARLDGVGQLDVLLRPDVPIFTHDGPLESVPPTTLVLIQAGSDAAMADALFAATAAGGPVTLDIANGMSQVTAGNITRYFDAAAGSDYLLTASVVFQSGAGVEIYLAAISGLENALGAALARSVDPRPWEEIAPALDFDRVADWALLLGHLEGYLADARWREVVSLDEARENANTWLAVINLAVSVGLSVLFAPASVGVAVGRLAGPLISIFWSGLSWFMAGEPGNARLEEALYQLDDAYDKTYENDALVFGGALDQSLVTVRGEPARFVRDAQGVVVLTVELADGSPLEVAIDPTSSGSYDLPGETDEELSWVNLLKHDDLDVRVGTIAFADFIDGVSGLIGRERNTGFDRVHSPSLDGS